MCSDKSRVSIGQEAEVQSPLPSTQRIEKIRRSVQPSDAPVFRPRFAGFLFSALTAFSFFLLSFLFLLSPGYSYAQTCPHPFILRQDTGISCPAGPTTCSVKSTQLTWTELDYWGLNSLALCNGPGQYTWPSPSSGLLSSNGSGVLSIVADDDTPDAGDFGALALTGDVTSSGLATTIGANSVALATDTTGNFAAGDAENGNATGLACTTCVDASDIAADAITEVKLKVVDAAADEECLTYESTTGDFEWQSCAAGGGGNSFATIDTTSGTDPVADSTTDTLTLTAGSGITITGDSATDTITIASTGGGVADPLTNFDIVEEFCSRNSTPNTHGTHGWMVYGSGTGDHAPEANHPCTANIYTAGSSGSMNAIGMGSAATTDSFIVASHLDRVTWVVKSDATITSMELRVGFMDDLMSTTGGDGFFAEYDSSVSPNWRCVTRQGGATTATTSAVAYAANTWFQVELERTSGGDHKCYVNSGTAFATHTTNLPTGNLSQGLAIQTNTTAARYVIYDYFRFKGKTLGSRY